MANILKILKMKNDRRNGVANDHIVSAVVDFVVRSRMQRLQMSCIQLLLVQQHDII